MDLWHPAPRPMIAALNKRQWSASNPAPDVAAYLWAWRLLEEGATVSIRDVSKYAGWGKTKAARILASLKEDFEAYYPERGTKRDSTGTAPGQTRDSTGTDGPKDYSGLGAPAGQSRDSTGTVAGQSRDARARDPSLDIDKTVTEHTSTSDPSAAPTAKAAGSPPIQVKKTWDEINDLRVEHKRGARARKLTPAIRRQLKARISDHSPYEVVGVVRWWLTSDHKRAKYLRENSYDLSTLLRASNFPEYLAMSQDDPTDTNGDGSVLDKWNGDTPLSDEQYACLFDYELSTMLTAPADAQTYSWNVRYYKRLPEHG